MKITYIRTSTLLLEAGGAVVLTDPWFAMTMRGLPCRQAPGVPLEEIPKPDVLLVSHLHPDHFDPFAVRRLCEKFDGMEIVGPRGTAAAARGLGAARTTEVEEWETVERAGFSFLATPALHTGHELNYAIEKNGARVFFGGDAKLSPHFHAIARRCPELDAAALPIGGTRVFGRQVVMGPDEAAQAVEILRPRFVIPIHEGGAWQSVPPLSRHPGRPHHLEKILRDRGIAAKILTLGLGESAEIEPCGVGAS